MPERAERKWIMGKQFTIENNEIKGLEFDLGFSSRSNAGTDRNVSAVWSFDGMASEDAAELLWSAFKVVVQRTTLKKASDAEIAKMKGQRLYAKDYLKAEAGGRTRELERQLEVDRARLKEITKAFMNAALAEATAELGPGASNEAVQNVTMRIFNEKYAALVK